MSVRGMKCSPVLGRGVIAPIRWPGRGLEAREFSPGTCNDLQRTKSRVLDLKMSVIRLGSS